MPTLQITKIHGKWSLFLEEIKTAIACHMYEKLTKKKQKQNFWQLSKFHVNLGFLLLRNNSDKIKYLTPQSTGLDKIRL